MYICQLNNGKLVSCSMDKSIKIWSITESLYHCDYTIENAHNNCVYKEIVLTKIDLYHTLKIQQLKYGMLIILMLI